MTTQLNWDNISISPARVEYKYRLNIFLNTTSNLIGEKGGVKMSVVLSTIVGLRKARGFTQTDISKELGITYVAYSKKENGKVDFSSTEIGTMAKIFGVDPGRFYKEL